MKLRLLLAFQTLLFTAAANAQQPPAPGEWQVTAGAAAVIGPQYLGDDSARVLPIPYVDIKYGPNLFLNVPRGLGAYLYTDKVGEGTFRWGVSLTPGFNGRDSDDIPGLDNVGIAIEAQSFVEYSYQNWSVGLTAAQDLGTGHDGFYVDASANYSSRIGQRGFGQIGVSARYADSSYMESFFEITPAESVASGLAAFDAGSGFESVAVQGLYTHQLTDKWQFAVVPEIRFAVDDARSSPISDRNIGYQVVTVIGYRF